MFRLTEADQYVGEAIDRGINYFDVAPSYGNAEQMLGPALAPYRDGVFLACKTGRRDAAGAQEELENSLRLMQTDHFDLYQLHAITSDEDVQQAFGPGGAMETFLKARDAGQGQAPRLQRPQRPRRAGRHEPVRLRQPAVPVQLRHLRAGRVSARR